MIRAIIRAAVAAAFIATAPAAFAKPVRIVPQDPIATVDVPDNWSVKAAPRGVEIRTPDEEVFLWFEVFRPADEKKVWAEHEAYFRGQGVRVTGAPRTTEDRDDKAVIRAAEFPATWNGAPTVLRYLSIDAKLPGGKVILMSVWASPEGDKSYHGAIGKIIESLR